MTPIIGGAADGDKCPMRIPRMTVKGETYMLVSYRDKEGEHFFYQLAGAVPAEVVKTWKVRYGK